MIDYFALLQLPRRPWLNVNNSGKYRQLSIAVIGSQTDRLPNKFQLRISRALTKATNSAGSEVASAHLLKLEGVAASADTVPETLADVFLETGTLVQESIVSSQNDRQRSEQSSAATGNPRDKKLAADMLDNCRRSTTTLSKSCKSSISSGFQLTRSHPSFPHCVCKTPRTCRAAIGGRLR